jgi:hypothetical protein
MFVPIDSKFQGPFELAPRVRVSVPEVKESAAYILDPRFNDSFAVANKLLDEGVKVWRLKDPVEVSKACPFCSYLPEPFTSRVLLRPFKRSSGCAKS